MQSGIIAQQAEALELEKSCFFYSGGSRTRDAIRYYRLFKFFCLKDRIFSSFIRRPRHLGPNSKEKGEEVVNTNAMEIESDLKLLKYIQIRRS